MENTKGRRRIENRIYWLTQITYPQVLNHGYNIINIKKVKKKKNLTKKKKEHIRRKKKKNKKRKK